MNNSNINELAQKGLSLNFAEGGEHRLVIGEKVEGLKDSDNLNIQAATMSGLINFVQDRKEEINARVKESHMQVNIAKGTILLTVGEHGKRKLVGDVNATPQITILGSSKNSEDFVLVKSLMKASGHGNSHELAMSLRGNAHIFESVSECGRVVSALRNFEVKIEAVRKDFSEDNRGREKRMSAMITEGAPDLTWSWNIELFEGESPVLIPVRAIYEVQSNMIDVNVVILDATGQGLTLMERRARRKLMEEAAGTIKEYVPSLPVVYVN